MKSIVRFLLAPCAAALFTPAAFAQVSAYIPADFKGEAPSPNGCFIRNKGQLLGTDGYVASKVTAYSMQYFPQTFIGRDNTLSIVLDARDTSATTLDTLMRIDIKFIGDHLNPSSNINLAEPLPDKYNFVLGHLTSPLLGQTSYRRVIYFDVYPFIDVHVYSNKWGPKLYMVMRPGANPTDLRMKFMGQDSLIMDAFGYLKPYIRGRNIVLPKGLCYQEIGGNLVLVNAQLAYQLDSASAEVNFMPVSYNPNYPLIVDISAMGPDDAADETIPPKWNTFYGSTASDWANDGTALPGGGLLVAGTTYSPLFPVFNSVVGLFQGMRMAYVSEFNGQYSRIYTTIFGGNGADDGNSVALSADGQSVYLFGKTTSTNLLVTDPGGGAFLDDSPGTLNCYIAQLSRTSNPPGAPLWVTYFGDGIASATCIRQSQQGDLYLLGSVSPAPNVQFTCDGTAGTFPMCNQLGPQAYQQSAYAGNVDIFLARFNSQRQLVHSTFFGGSSIDYGYQLAIRHSTGRVYITGFTGSSRSSAYVNCQPPASGNFPLCNLPGSYFQEDLNHGVPTYQTDAFIAGFEDNGSLFWSTYFGGDQEDHAHAIAINPATNQLYIGGVADGYTGYATNECQPPSGAGFPSCASGVQTQYPVPAGLDDGFLAKFSLLDHSLLWTTVLGGSGIDVVTALDWDEGGNVWVAGLTYSGNIPLAQMNGVYYQDANGYPGINATADAMIFSFSPQDELRHGTYMGGMGQEHPYFIAAPISGQLYMGGSSSSTSAYPFACPSTTNPYCYLTYATMQPGTMEAFYADLRHGEGVGVEEHTNADGNDSPLFIMPNPGEGIFSLVLPVEFKGPFKLSVHDALGKVCLNEVRNARQGGSLQTIDLQALNAGMYMVQLRTLDGNVERRAKLLIE
ncbi:MAG: T9SS type A sorting domain-containing protein [Bacteroidetes bacterium]|nr:T9SS type A sorting domain-containing protein [Bacteroidota bacterium]